MPILENARGKRMQLVLPPADWPELAKARTTYMRLASEERQTYKVRSRLEGERTSAIRKDTDAYAEALKQAAESGKPAPEETRSEQLDRIEKEIEACNRRLEALKEALDRAESDLIDTVIEHRKEWVEDAGAKLDEAFSAYATAVEALIEARDRVSERFGVLAWVRSFPDEVITYKPGYIRVPLKAPNDEDYYFNQLAEILRKDATRPDPTPPAAIPWGRAAHEAITGRTASNT